MRFLIKRLWIILLIALAGYVFWPRTPSLRDFHPERCAEIQIATWKDCAAGNVRGVIFPLYELYEREFGIPPITALLMALDQSTAWKLFAAAPDTADQEKALPVLGSFYAKLKTATKATFDPAIAARIELATWRLSTDASTRPQLTSALADQMALIHGRTSGECLPAAKKMARARNAAAEGNWTEASRQCREAWTDLHALVTAGTP